MVIYDVFIKVLYVICLFWCKGNSAEVSFIATKSVHKKQGEQALDSHYFQLRS